MLELSIKHAALSDFTVAEGETSCSANFKDVLLKAFAGIDSAAVMADSFSAKVVLDKEKLDEFTENPNITLNPLIRFDRLDLRGFKTDFNEKTVMTMESATGDYFVVKTRFYVNESDNNSLNVLLTDDPFSPNNNTSIYSNLVFYGQKEYKIDWIESINTYEEGVNSKKINIESIELFSFDLSYSIGYGTQTSSSDTGNTLVDLLNDLKMLPLYDFEVNYTDRSLVTIALDHYAESKALSRDEIIGILKHYVAALRFFKEPEILAENLADFLKEPKTMTIKINLAEPDYIGVLLEDIDKLGLSFSFNDRVYIAKKP
jgi:hypothetical protein